MRSGCREVQRGFTEVAEASISTRRAPSKVWSFSEQEGPAVTKLWRLACKQTSRSWWPRLGLNSFRRPMKEEGRAGCYPGRTGAHVVASGVPFSSPRTGVQALFGDSSGAPTCLQVPPGSGARAPERPCSVQGQLEVGEEAVPDLAGVLPQTQSNLCPPTPEPGVFSGTRELTVECFYVKH